MLIVAFGSTLLVGALGSLCAKKLKIPGGALIGALFFTVIFNVATGKGYFHGGCLNALRFFTGIYLGTRIDKDTLSRLRTVWKAALIMLLGLFTMNAAVGSLMSSICDIDIGTAVMATAPGGMTELSLYASEIGADVATVATLQVIRVFTNIGFMPLIIKKLSERRKTYQRQRAADINDKKSDTEERKCPIAVTGAVILAGACAGVWILGKTGIPSSMMLGAMAGTLLVNLTFDEVHLSSEAGIILQTITGAYVGTTITRHQLLALLHMLPGVLLMIVSFLAGTVILGALIYRMTDIDFATALFSCAPGGISDMALIAIDMGADVAVIVAMHTIRLISLIVVIPYIIEFLQRFF